MKRKREKEIWAPGGVFGILVDQEFWDLVPDVEGHKMKGSQEAANRNLDWRVGTSNTAAVVPALLHVRFQWPLVLAQSENVPRVISTSNWNSSWPHKHLSIN